MPTEDKTFSDALDRSTMTVSRGLNFSPRMRI